MQTMKKFIHLPAVPPLLEKLSQEYSVVKNPDYVFPPYEIYPLAAKIQEPLHKISGVVMDMDGTTTTTETLCIHSLEYMIRKVTHRMTAADWEGLDPKQDYPHIIGNSTTKHVEYLVEKYRDLIDLDALGHAFLSAVFWLLIQGKDQNRKEEVLNNIQNLGLQDLLRDKRTQEIIEGRIKLQTDIIDRFVTSHRSIFSEIDFSNMVRACIDIYYQRYHDILAKIQQGKGEEISRELIPSKGAHLIEPMPAIGIYLALLKGWLREELVHFADFLVEEWKKCDPTGSKNMNVTQIKKSLKYLGSYFQEQPAKVAVVTSSIFYEADIVLNEVFRILQNEASRWPISEEKKNQIIRHFDTYKNYYDAFVTASDSSEIRLKPHRDLYSIALHRLGIAKNNFHEVIGFEDSESGTIAIRAAGIGMCIAVPFSETANHDFTAASLVLRCGIPEALLRYHGFLKIEGASESSRSN